MKSFKLVFGYFKLKHFRCALWVFQPLDNPFFPIFFKCIKVIYNFVEFSYLSVSLPCKGEPYQFMRWLAISFSTHIQTAILLLYFKDYFRFLYLSVYLWEGRNGMLILKYDWIHKYWFPSIRPHTNTREAGYV